MWFHRHLPKQHSPRLKSLTLNLVTRWSVQELFLPTETPYVSGDTAVSLRHMDAEPSAFSKRPSEVFQTTNGRSSDLRVLGMQP